MTFEFFYLESPTVWSKIGWKLSQPECPKQSLEEPAGSGPLFQVLEEYADNQSSWINDFVGSFVKMQENGYGPNDLTTAPDTWQMDKITCTRAKR